MKKIFAIALSLSLSGPAVADVDFPFTPSGRPPVERLIACGGDICIEYRCVNGNCTKVREYPRPQGYEPLTVDDF